MTTQRDPREVMITGAQVLQEVLNPHGFVFALEREGRSSGGHFASGKFTRGNRVLELHFRHSLGLVSYAVGPQRLEHADYVRAMRATGMTEEQVYPGFSDDPLGGFRHLKRDLVHFGSRFLNGTDAEFQQLVTWVAENPRKTGIGAT